MNYKSILVIVLSAILFMSIIAYNINKTFTKVVEMKEKRMNEVLGE